MTTVSNTTATAPKRELTGKDYRRFYAIRAAQKAKAASGEQAPKAPRTGNFDVVTLDTTKYNATVGQTKGDNSVAYAKLVGVEDQKTVMAFGGIYDALANSDGPLQVVIRTGLGVAKVMAIVANDGSMTDEHGEAFDIEAARLPRAA